MSVRVQDLRLDRHVVFVGERKDGIRNQSCRAVKASFNQSQDMGAKEQKWPTLQKVTGKAVSSGEIGVHTHPNKMERDTSKNTFRLERILLMGE